jgi:hypothetical protein
MPFQEYGHPGSRTLPASCGAPAPSASEQELERLDEAVYRLHRVVHAVYNYNMEEGLALEGKAVDGLRKQALESFSEYVESGSAESEFA